MRRLQAIVAGAALFALTACTASTPREPNASGTGPDPAEPLAAETTLPEEPSVAVADDDPVAQALAVAGELYASAPVVVTAPADDPAAQLGAASAAVALGTPMLLLTAAETSSAASTAERQDAGAAADVLAGELDRLGTGTVLAFGAAPEVDVDVIAAPADPAGLAEVLGLAAEEIPVDPGAEVTAAATLQPGRLGVLRAAAAEESAESPTGDASGSFAQPTDDATGGAQPTDDATGSAQPTDDATLPLTEPAEPVEGLLVLTTGAPEQLAAVATARAAGADVVVAPDGDPRATSATVQAVAASAPTHVLGLGTSDAETLSWRTATAATGVELPGGGQLVLPGKTYVALYGHPATSALGVLGEQGPEATVERVREHAAPYEPITDTTVIPALEIIATIASAGPGDDGNYSAESTIEELRPLVDLAGDQGLYVVLDLQPGRTDFVTQAQRYEELLKLPHVGLALDPEWRLKPDQVHLRQIGQVDVAEVNEVVTYLADLVRENHLPQKLLVLHQFQVRMIPGVDGVDQSRSELAVLIHADGQGSQPAKQETWATLRAHAPSVRWWGWKNFYDEDVPMLTPEQTAQVDPFPQFISYQ